MHTFIHVKLCSFIYLFFNLCSSQVISQSVRQVFPEVGVSPGKRLKYKSYTGYPSSWQFIVLEKNKQTDGEIREKDEYR